MALLLAFTSVANAQDISLPKVPTDGSVSIEQLRSAISAVEVHEGLDDEVRASVIEQLRDAEAQVRNRISAEAAASGYTAALETSPAETAALRATLDEDVGPAPSAASLGITDDTTLAELELAQLTEVAELKAMDARLSGLESEITAQQTRPAEARERINALRQSREQLAAAIAAPLPSGEQQILTESRRLAADLRRAAQDAEINRLEQELSSHSARLDLLRAQRDVTTRSRVEAVRRVELLRTLANEKRQVTAVLAQQQAAEAELAAAGKHPIVRTLAEENATITRALPGVAADIEQASATLNQVKDEAEEFAQRLARSRQRLEVGGMSRVIGRLLVDEQRNLPQVSQYRATIRTRQATLADIGLAQVRIREQRRELTLMTALLDETMARIAEDVSNEQDLASIRDEIRLLLRDRRELLDQADSTYRSYLQVLSEFDVAQRRLLDTAEEYGAFLDQTLMWIPSAPVIGMGSWSDVSRAAAWALSAKSWLAIGPALVESLRERATAAIFTLILLAVLVATRKRLAMRNKTLNARVGRLSTDNIGLTLAALAMAAVRSLPLPLLLFIIGWSLDHGPLQSAFSTAVGRGLLVVAPFLYNLLLFRVLCASEGVMQVHFGWREDNLTIIRRQLDRLVAAGVPLAFVTVMFFFFSSEEATDRTTLGRLAFVALLVILSLSIRPLTHPNTGVAASYYDRNPTGWVSRLKWLWHLLGSFVPLLIGLMALLGYIYTSTMLTRSLVDTIWLALGLIVVNMLVLRWLALARRKLAWQRALKEREARKAERDQGPEQPAEGELPVVEPRPLDLNAVDLQTRKLLRAGILIVAVVAGLRLWSDVLPAFNLLEQVALWSKTDIVDGVETLAPVTLADVLLALVVAAITLVASRNLPGLMEIAVIQHLTLQPGGRYTINTLFRYIVITVGLISVLNIVGWNWSQIQWLVAALSVGLGFGLQEIVANFVSGLIILFERPVRVGDTVTVGQLTGTVSRVRIRATTITDWDRKEILVPNKSFISEQVVNWTLSDPITRVVIPVGISYGSDVQLAHTVMEDTLRALPLVLDEPEPRVYFLGFGDSSLDFELHVYSSQLTDRLPLMHAVHEAILGALREHGIEIPFPQRDLHVRSTEDSSALPDSGLRPAAQPGSAAS